MLYIDFEGVICSEFKDELSTAICRYQKRFPNLSKRAVYEEFNWYQFLRDKNPGDRILETVKSNTKPMTSIVIKAFSYDEVRAKLAFLKAFDIPNNVIVCPRQLELASIIQTSLKGKKHILVDSDISAISSWINNGGFGLIFGPEKYSLCMSIVNLQDAYDIYQKYH